MTEPTTFYIECWGCGKSITKQADNWCAFQTRIDQLISQEGWVRREFGPNSSPWFCSTLCAYQSPAARQCEKWWHHHPAPHWFEKIIKDFLSKLGL